MSDERARDESSKELTIGFFNPISAPFLRHDRGEGEEGTTEENEKEQQQEEEEEEEEEEEDSGDFDMRSVEELSEEERKEYFRYLQEDLERQMEEDEEERKAYREALYEKDKKEYLEILETRKKELLMKVTLDCMKKCTYFKTHPWLPRGIVLFKKEEKCIENCAKKMLQVLSIVDKLDEDGEISYGEMIARQFGVSDDL